MSHLRHLQYIVLLQLLSILAIPAGAQSHVPPAADWWTAVRENLIRREYEFRSTDDGVKAPNRAQNLRSTFDRDGLRLEPRLGGDAAWTWTWRTSAWGRGELTPVLADVDPVATAMRVVFQRGVFSEWYENRRDGLEQGFTLPTRPAGKGPLYFEGAIEGEHISAVSASGNVIQFCRANGMKAFSYGGLHAWDATGRELPATMSLAEGRIRLEVDDRAAVYPVTIDPIIDTPAQTLHWTEEEAHFGFCVAPAGDINSDGYCDLVVGAPDYDQGRGYAALYLGDPTGVSSEPVWDYVTANANDQMGFAVSGAGDVNNDGFDDFLVARPGFAEGKGLIQLHFGDAEPSYTHWENFNEVGQWRVGESVAPAGDIDDDGYDDFLFGAPSYCDAQFYYRGKAVLICGGNPDFGDTVTIAEGADDNCRLGKSIATAGDINGDGAGDVLIGAPEGTWTWQGGYVEVWYGPGSNQLEPEYLQSGSNNPDYDFGKSVSTAGDVNGDGYADVLVGEPAAGTGGIARCYYGGPSGLGMPSEWYFEGDVAHLHLGISVATAGDVNADGYADVIIGGCGDPETSQPGRVYVFCGSSSGLSTEPYWEGECDQATASYGTSVATAGDLNGDGLSDLIVGASTYTVDQLEEGAVFIYLSSLDDPPFTDNWHAQANQTDAHLGWSVATAGDINGDGYSEIMVGAPDYDYGYADEGAVFLYEGRRGGPLPSVSWYALGHQEGAHFGVDVAPAGDVNNDGLMDIIVGADLYDDTYEDEGGAFLWMAPLPGSPGTPSNADWSATGGQADAKFGTSVATAGDVNADGFADIIVGAPYASYGLTREGSAFVYHGSEDGPSQNENWFRNSGKAYAEYGYCVASAGDFDGDGYGDIAVGSPRYGDSQYAEGKVFLYAGSETGPSTGAPFWRAQSNQAWARLGYSTASAGDVNGDGYSDLIAGAPFFDSGYEDCGQAFIWHGGPGPPPLGDPTNADWVMGVAQAEAHLGWSVAGAGDVNNDGLSDVIVGCPRYDAGFEDVGLAALWYGTPTGVPTSPADWFYIGDVEDGQCGFSVAPAGDVDADGFCDLIVGAFGYTHNHSGEGRAFLYQGNGGGGLERAPRQWSSQLDNLIAPMGRPLHAARFYLSAAGRTPAGRDYVRLECEVKPVGTPFDGSGTILGDWELTGFPTAQNGSVITLCNPINVGTDDVDYHWRMRLWSDNLYFPTRSRWFTLAWNSASEIDVQFVSDPSSTPEEETLCPTRLHLSGQPNPFTVATDLTYRLPQAGRVRLTVCDLEGRCVRTLIDDIQGAGVRRVSWDGKDRHGNALSAGIYMVTLITESEESSESLVLLK